MLDRTAFCLVFANFGMAIAARMPMITITISSSIRVKPLRFDMSDLRHGLTAESRPREGWRYRRAQPLHAGRCDHQPSCANVALYFPAQSPFQATHQESRATLQRRYPSHDSHLFDRPARWCRGASLLGTLRFCRVVVSHACD